MKLLLSFALVLSVAGCKKKEAEQTAAPPPAPAVGSASPADAGSAAPETPDAATAAATGSAAGSAGSDNGSAAGDGDCAVYARVAAACGRGADAKTLQAQCENALAKNNAMASSVKVWIGCAKADAACDAYKKCLANTR